jgi:hypothetical protein
VSLLDVIELLRWSKIDSGRVLEHGPSSRDGSHLPLTSQVASGSPEYTSTSTIDASTNSSSSDVPPALTVTSPSQASTDSSSLAPSVPTGPRSMSVQPAESPSYVRERRGKSLELPSKPFPTSKKKLSCCSSRDPSLDSHSTQKQLLLDVRQSESSVEAVPAIRWTLQEGRWQRPLHLRRTRHLLQLRARFLLPVRAL